MAGWGSGVELTPPLSILSAGTRSNEGSQSCDRGKECHDRKTVCGRPHFVVVLTPIGMVGATAKNAPMWPGFDRKAKTAHPEMRSSKATFVTILSVGNHVAASL